MSLLEQLFGGLGRRPDPKSVLNPEELAKKVVEFAATRGKVAAQSKQVLGVSREVLDRPPDVLQGAMSGITASQVTKLLRDKPVLEGGTPAERRRDAKGRFLPTSGQPQVQPVLAQRAAEPSQPVTPRPGAFGPMRQGLTVAGGQPHEAADRDPGLKAASQRLDEFAEALKDGAEELKRLSRPVSEEIKGLSLAQRYDRLKEAGALATQQQFAQETGASMFEPATQKQIVEFSEGQQQKDREGKAKRLLAEKAKETQGGGAGGAPAFGHPAMLAATAVFAGLTMAVGKLKASAEAVADDSRLAMFSGLIASSQGLKDLEQLRSEARLARATEGGVALKAAAERNLIRERGETAAILKPFVDALKGAFADVRAEGHQFFQKVAEDWGVKNMGQNMEAAAKWKVGDELGQPMNFHKFFQEMQQAPPHPVNQPPKFNLPRLDNINRD